MSDCITPRRPRITSELGPLVSRRDVAAMFGVNARTVTRWVKSGQLPPPDIRMNRKTVRWRIATITEAMAA